LIGTGDYTFELNANWGRLPEGVKYNNSHAVVVDSLDRVYIHNLSKDAVIVFSSEGEFLNSWGEWLADGAHGMQLNKEPDAWTRDGWPEIPTSDYKPDRFVSPHAACANSKGDIFVVDWVPLGRVSKLTRL
jgi:hypothetical protein